MKILHANPSHAADIARLIISAMTDDCCQFLVGHGHTLEDFHNAPTRAYGRLAVQLAQRLCGCR